MPEFSVTVLGAGPAWANPGGACSGYLLSHGDDHVLLECGFGILSRLRERLPLDRLAAVVISHLHADHFMDLVPLRYGLKYGGLRKNPRLPLYAPPGAGEFFERLGRALDGDPRFFDGTFALTEYSPSAPQWIASFSFTFQRVKHYIPAYAMAIQAERRLAFSADAAPCPALVRLAQGSDLFLCEAALRSRRQDDPDPERRGHMTPAEAGQVSRQANVGCLLLTHYRSEPTGNDDLLRAAAEAFGGPTELAVEGRRYVV